MNKSYDDFDPELGLLDDEKERETQKKKIKSKKNLMYASSLHPSTCNPNPSPMPIRQPLKKEP